MALTEEQEENIARKVAMEMDDEVGLSQRTTGWWPIRFAVRFLAALPDYKAQLKDLREQVECSTITRDNMEGRLNIATVKLAAMKQQRDALLGLIERIGEDGNYHLLGSGIRIQIFDAIASVKGGA